MDRVAQSNRGHALIEAPEALIEAVLGSAIAVHDELGPGLLEHVYEAALRLELAGRGIAARVQQEVPARYKGVDLGVGFRADMIVENCLLLELKAVERLTDAHLAQVLTYLRLLRYKRGFLLNFNEKLLKDGIKRVSI